RGETMVEAWWFFGSIRAGTALMHGCASGLSALGVYGILRGRWRYALCYPGGVSIHASWNFLVYLIWGDAGFTRSGWDSPVLDIVGGVGLVALIAAVTALLWILSGRLRDEGPAPIYFALGLS